MFKDLYRFHEFWLCTYRSIKILEQQFLKWFETIYNNNNFRGWLKYRIVAIRSESREGSCGQGAKQIHYVNQWIEYRFIMQENDILRERNWTPFVSGQTDSFQNRRKISNTLFTINLNRNYICILQSFQYALLLPTLSIEEYIVFRRTIFSMKFDKVFIY